MANADSQTKRRNKIPPTKTITVLKEFHVGSSVTCRSSKGWLSRRSSNLISPGRGGVGRGAGVGATGVAGVAGGILLPPDQGQSRSHFGLGRRYADPPSYSVTRYDEVDDLAGVATIQRSAHTPLWHQDFQRLAVVEYTEWTPTLVLQSKHLPFHTVQPTVSITGTPVRGPHVLFRRCGRLFVPTTTTGNEPDEPANGGADSATSRIAGYSIADPSTNRGAGDGRLSTAHRLHFTIIHRIETARCPKAIGIAVPDQVL